MLNFGASKPRVKGGPGSPEPPPDPHLISTLLYSCSYLYLLIGGSGRGAMRSPRTAQKFLNSMQFI